MKVEVMEEPIIYTLQKTKNRYVMAPHIIKGNYFEFLAKKIQNLMNDISSERFSNKRYVVLQVLIWVLISFVVAYYFIK